MGCMMRLSFCGSDLFVSRTQERPIAGNAHTVHCDVILRNQLVSANALSQVPDSDDASTIATDELTLIGMDHNVVDRGLVSIIALQTAGARVPHFNRVVLGTGHHPLPFAVESNAGDVVRVAIKRHDRVRVG